MKLWKLRISGSARTCSTIELFGEKPPAMPRKTSPLPVCLWVLFQNRSLRMFKMHVYLKDSQCVSAHIQMTLAEFKSTTNMLICVLLYYPVLVQWFKMFKMIPNSNGSKMFKDIATTSCWDRRWWPGATTIPDTKAPWASHERRGLKTGLAGALALSLALAAVGWKIGKGSRATKFTKYDDVKELRKSVIWSLSLFDAHNQGSASEAPTSSQSGFAGIYLGKSGWWNTQSYDATLPGWSMALADHGWSQQTQFFRAHPS